MRNKLLSTDLANYSSIILIREKNNLQTKEHKDMIDNQSEIKNIIELLRKRLGNVFESKKDPMNPEVLAISQALDRALNEYYRLCQPHQEIGSEDNPEE